MGGHLEKIKWIKWMEINQIFKYSHLKKMKLQSMRKTHENLQFHRREGLSISLNPMKVLVGKQFHIISCIFPNNFFGGTHGTQKYWGQGSNPHLNSDPRSCRDHAGSLTHCATEGIPWFTYIFLKLYTQIIKTKATDENS